MTKQHSLRFNRISIVMTILLMVLTLTIMRSVVQTYATSTTLAEKTILDSGTCGVDLIWRIDTKYPQYVDNKGSKVCRLVISGNGVMDDYKVYDEEYAPWKYSNYGEQIREIVIEEGVESIGNGAFYHMDSLRKVTISNTVKKIGDSAFRFCGKLESIDIPGSVREIGTCAFWNYSSKRDGKPMNVTFHEGLETIGSGAFFGNNYINCDLPSTLSYIGRDGLGGSYYNKTITIPSAMTVISSGAFLHCNFESVIIHNKVTKIDSEAFFDCNNLRRLDLPSSITYIGDGAFAACSSLKSVKIPNGVRVIGEGAFKYCKKLESITIPGTVKVIKVGTFCECRKLRKVYIKRGVTTIGQNAFQDCKSLTKLTLPASIKSIRLNAFYKSGIKVLTIKTKKLSKKTVEDSLKYSKIKTVSVKVGKKKTNKKYIKKYKEYFSKKNCGRRVTVK